ncbi:MAG: putative family nitrogen regulatory protein, partial [Dehalococcoidia bacterium]|nr:putative family nitrogen regulatory protein [Dehalococcoidia bacterium]
MNSPTITKSRKGINYPKFADKFALLDFDTEPMTDISLCPVPAHLSPDQLHISVSGLECKSQIISWSLCSSLPRVSMKAPL